MPDTTAIAQTVGGEYWSILKGLSPWVLPVVTLLVGYLVGSYKFFKEEQSRLYQEILPALLRGVHKRNGLEVEAGFNAALAKTWLFGSTSVALAVDKVAKSIGPTGSYAETIPAIQDAILAMRKDVQPWWRYSRRKLPKDKIKHWHMNFRTN